MDTWKRGQTNSLKSNQALSTVTTCHLSVSTFLEQAACLLPGMT